MSYNTAIPQITDARAQSQRQILANMQAIARVWANNHYPLNGQDNEFYGMHTVLTMRPQIDHPTTGVNQVALYNKLVSTIPELFFRPQNNQDPIQLTYSSISTGSGGTQYSFIAGPFIVHLGFIENIAGIPNGQVVTLTPGTSLIYANITASDVKIKNTKNNFAFITAINVNTPGNSFTINYPPLGTTDLIRVVYYIAIGV